MINTVILSRTVSKLSQIIFQILDEKLLVCVLTPPLQGLSKSNVRKVLRLRRYERILIGNWRF